MCSRLGLTHAPLRRLPRQESQQTEAHYEKPGCLVKVRTLRDDVNDSIAIPHAVAAAGSYMKSMRADGDACIDGGSRSARIQPCRINAVHTILKLDFFRRSEIYCLEMQLHVVSSWRQHRSE